MPGRDLAMGLKTTTIRMDGRTKCRRARISASTFADRAQNGLPGGHRCYLVLTRITISYVLICAKDVCTGEKAGEGIGFPGRSTPTVADDRRITM